MFYIIKDYFEKRDDKNIYVFGLKGGERGLYCLRFGWLCKNILWGFLGNKCGLGKLEG